MTRAYMHPDAEAHAYRVFVERFSDDLGAWVAERHEGPYGTLGAAKGSRTRIQRENECYGIKNYRTSVQRTKNPEWEDAA